MALQQLSRQSNKLLKSFLAASTSVSSVSSNISSSNSTIPTIQKRKYYWKGIYLHPGPGEIDLDDGAEKPEGVPETWSSIDIHGTDFGRFDESTFPPALEGETLEQYCRRVPNVWSPCSNASDVVDTNVHMEIVYAADPGPTKVGILEEALVKIPPESADWHVTYVPDYEGMLREMMFRTRPFPIKVTDAEFEVMLSEFERGVQERGIDYHFRARSFHEFWEELTGKSLKEIANVPTWEEEIDRRIQLAIARNAQKQLDDKNNKSVEAN